MRGRHKDIQDSFRKVRWRYNTNPDRVWYACS